MIRFIFIFFTSIFYALDYCIPPEVFNDSLYKKIIEISADAEVRTILEIGSSSGEGSTSAFILGMQKNLNKPLLFCMEVSKVRFEKLSDYYKDNEQVKLYNVSSVPLTEFPSKEKIIFFMHRYNSNLKKYSEQTVLDWLNQDIEYISDSGVEQNGIEIVKKMNQIAYFDVVFIDGSEFTGEAEFKQIYGAKYILLDDVCAYKNFFNYRQLQKDLNYKLIAQDLSLRNGWALFKKRQ